MERPALLQTAPEAFRVTLPDGRVLLAELAHETRRGLGLVGVPPLTVATEMVVLLLERDALGPAVAPDGAALALGPAVGRFPEGFEELRVRCT